MDYSVNKNYKKLLFGSFLFLNLVVNTTIIGQSVSKPASGYQKASYKLSEKGKYMKNWMIAGPVSVSADSKPENEVQEKAFKEDFLTSVKIVSGKSLDRLRLNQKDINWNMVSSTSDVVELDNVIEGKDKDFVYAYALAEILAENESTVMLGVGSDDAIKIWLNGKLVHENWIPRSVKKDEDFVPLKLVKGSNQLLLKVQDMQGGWAFVARLLDKEALTEELSSAAAHGNLDKIKLLLQMEADINGKSKGGISPIVAAKISGREEAVKLLLQSGAKDVSVPYTDLILDNYYAPLQNKQSPGIALLVARDGKIVYEKGFGYADLTNKKIVTKDTKFRIGSVTKQFTAAAILKLQEMSLLSVNDPLSKFIPDFPRGNEVTIHHLLTHTSGIQSYTSKPGFMNNVTKTISEDSLIKFFKNDPYNFNPGENFMYNNSGYFLLGYIIGKVSGKPYGAFLKETFFDPLGMKNTGVYSAGLNLENEALGYSFNNDKYESAINWDMSWAGAAGALYSTLEDILKWNHALHSGKLLNEASMKAALTPVVLKNNNKPPGDYGYGLAMSKYRGQEVIHHSGGLNGFISQLAYYPRQKLSIVMFHNSLSPDVPFDPNKIAEAYLWNEMDSQSSYSVSSVKPQNLKALAGRYDLMNSVLEVTTEGEKLYAQLSGQPKFEIFPSAENEFFWKVVEARVKFVKDEKGDIAHAVIYQHGQEMKAQRLAEEKIININPELLDNYTGKYKLSDNLVVTVSKEKERLFAQATDQPKFELLPVSETDFVVKEINARISFIPENGVVNKFKLKMNGTENILPRIQ